MLSTPFYEGRFLSTVPHPFETCMQVGGNPWLDPTHYVSAGWWGEQGSASGQFESIWQLAIDSAGNVLVMDGALKRIQTFTATGEYVLTIGESGDAPNQLRSLADFATDDEDRVFAVDWLAGQVKIFASNGTFLAAWSTPPPGPQNIWIHGSDVFLTNPDERVLRFNLAGGLLTLWGQSGTEPGNFSCIGAVTTVSDGTVIVADWGNKRLQRFTDNGTFLSAIDLSLLSATESWLDNDLWIDRDDYLYLTDRENNQLLKLNLLGELIARWGQAGNRTGELLDPVGLAVNAWGTVYVTEGDNYRVQWFIPIIGGPLVRFVGAALVTSLCVIIAVGVWVWMRRQRRTKVSTSARQKTRAESSTQKTAVP